MQKCAVKYANMQESASMFCILCIYSHSHFANAARAGPGRALRPPPNRPPLVHLRRLRGSGCPECYSVAVLL